MCVGGGAGRGAGARQGAAQKREETELRAQSCKNHAADTWVPRNFPMWLNTHYLLYPRSYPVPVGLTLFQFQNEDTRLRGLLACSRGPGGPLTDPGVEYASPGCHVIIYWVSGKTVCVEAWKGPQNPKSKAAPRWGVFWAAGLGAQRTWVITRQLSLYCDRLSKPSFDRRTPRAHLSRLVSIVELWRGVGPPDVWALSSIPPRLDKSQIVISFSPKAVKTQRGFKHSAWETPNGRKELRCYSTTPLFFALLHEMRHLPISINSALGVSEGR